MDITGKRSACDNLDMESESTGKRLRVTFASEQEELESCCDSESKYGQEDHPPQQKSIEDYYRPSLKSTGSSELDIHMNFAAPNCEVCGESLEEDDAMMACECAFCCLKGCANCTFVCLNCKYRFCSSCSLVNYDANYERRVCIDCNCSSSFG
jgi:hypothetical protein